jgi:hypothetical protein
MARGRVFDRSSSLSLANRILLAFATTALRPEEPFRSTRAGANFALPSDLVFADALIALVEFNAALGVLARLP